MNLEDKIAVVTGASDSMGKATAEKLASEGAAVVVHYSKGKEQAMAVVKAIEAKGGKAIALQAYESASRQSILTDMAERFMKTLQQAESSGEVDSLVALFADTADLINLAMIQPLQGRESIRQFWQNYLSVFNHIQSHFTHVSEANGSITLEWISEGNLASGEPISYRGVSILETQDGQVQHFRTYYDSAAFLP